MSPPPNGVNAQDLWPRGTAFRTYSLNGPICTSIDDILSTGSAEKQCLQTERVCDIVEIPQSRMATATSRPPARDIRNTVNPPRGFHQSAMLTIATGCGIIGYISYRCLWLYISSN